MTNEEQEFIISKVVRAEFLDMCGITGLINNDNKPVSIELLKE